MATLFRPQAVAWSRASAVVSAPQGPGRRRKPPNRAAGVLLFAVGNLAEDSGGSQADAGRAVSRVSLSVASIKSPRGGSAAREAASETLNKDIDSEPLSAVSVDSSVSSSTLIPILPSEFADRASSRPVFRSLGSKSDPVLHVRYPKPWSVVAENRRISNWRCLLNLVRTAFLDSE